MALLVCKSMRRTVLWQPVLYLSIIMMMYMKLLNSATHHVWIIILKWISQKCYITIRKRTPETRQLNSLINSFIVEKIMSIRFVVVEGRLALWVPLCMYNDYISCSASGSFRRQVKSSISKSHTEEYKDLHFHSRAQRGHSFRSSLQTKCWTWCLSVRRWFRQVQQW